MTAKKRSGTTKKSPTKKSAAKKSLSKKKISKAINKKSANGITAKSGGATSFKKGDHVEWMTSQGMTNGVVERKLVRPGSIKGHAIAASPDNPEYLVRSAKSGRPAAHKPGSLKKAR